MGQNQKMCLLEKVCSSLAKTTPTITHYFASRYKKTIYDFRAKTYFIVCLDKKRLPGTQGPIQSVVPSTNFHQIGKSLWRE